MADFILANANFAIDDQRSQIALAPGKKGELLLTLEIHGDQGVFDRLNSEEGSAWTWALYPPHFYLRNYPVPPAASDKAVTVKLKPEDSANYDVALYMMEHSDVERVVIQITKGTQVEVSGRVAAGALIEGQPEFRIKWTRGG
jgi:hypothetical protein